MSVIMTIRRLLGQRIANIERAAQSFIDGVIVRLIIADDEGIGGNIGGIRATAEKVTRSLNSMDRPSFHFGDGSVL